MSAIVHTCSCGATHTLDQWRALRLCGLQEAPAGLDPAREPAFTIEMRDCDVCASTRSVDVAELQEVWRAIPCLDGYEVSSFGRVRSWRARNNNPAPTAPLLRKGYKNHSGYELVRLAGLGRSVHRLVLLAFRGLPPSERHHAAHLNGVRDDNRLANLAWASPEENEAHKKAHGTALVGERHHMAKLTEAQASEIRARRASGEKLDALGAEFGVSASTVSLISKNKIWKTAEADAAHAVAFFQELNRSMGLPS